MKRCIPVSGAQSRGQGVTAVVCVAVFFAAFDPSRPAFAYVDPGSGSILLQLLLGGIAGVGVIVKLYWRRFKDRFRFMLGEEHKH